MRTIEINKKSRIDHKIISISAKRQVTLPQKYFEALGFDNEAECLLKDGGIFIRPIHSAANEFAEEILPDLIAQGYSGTELLEQFKMQNTNNTKVADHFTVSGFYVPIFIKLWYTKFH